MLTARSGFRSITFGATHVATRARAVRDISVCCVYSSTAEEAPGLPGWGNPVCMGQGFAYSIAEGNTKRKRLAAQSDPTQQPAIILIARA